MPENNKILGRPIDILLIEDNPRDITLFQEAFDNGNTTNDIHVVRDGVEALDYMFKRGKHVNVMTPDIVFLDISMPKKNGIEVLQAIKADKELRMVPVIMLSTSNNKEDIVRAYKNYANSYIIKPIDFNKFVEIIKTVESFWMTLSELPI